MLRSILFVTYAWFFTCSCHFGAGIGETKRTPNEFLNKATADKQVYQADKLKISGQLERFLLSHEKSFYSKEYFDSTLLAVDTILYNDDLGRVAVFVYSKNPTIRQLVPEPNSQSYYNAYCYLGKRQSDSFDLKWLRRFYLINYYDEKEITSHIKQMYFKEFATLKNADNSYTYKVNLDDKRFWDCSVWGEYYEP